MASSAALMLQWSMIAPTSGGPTILPICTAALKCATASSKVRWSTRSATIATRAGWFNACNEPNSAAATYTCQTAITPASDSAASAEIDTPTASWIVINRRLRSTRSAITPPTMSRPTLGNP